MYMMLQKVYTTQKGGNLIKKRQVVVQFCADFTPDEQISAVFELMVEKYPQIIFLKVDAEKFEDVIVRFEVPSVPSFLLFKNGRVVDKILGPNAMDLTDSLAGNFDELQNGISHNSGQDEGEENGIETKLTDKIRKRIIAYLANNPITVFMKGTPKNPKTNFDRRLINVLKLDEIDFWHYDILQDDDFAEGLKEFSHWPVFPQLWVDRELLGGCDVILEMRETGELDQKIQACQQKVANHPKTKLNKLLKQNSVILFTKTDSSSFSTSRVANGLEEEGIDFEEVELSGEEDLQKLIKNISSWPVFPQLFVRGQFIGGKDVLLELKSSGELGDAVNQVLSQG
eukprot:TRINITY_DN36467_c0_g1_i1.p2 TRINITY_DN36467_c0_g1~~TRINITY_DN36467_c0_g1_i1.p2  ORF type:complete len:341 (-),score=62.72 TRINITY_DN36467_c0_g1_i1:131-1153(-)